MRRPLPHAPGARFPCSMKSRGETAVPYTAQAVRLRRGALQRSQLEWTSGRLLSGWSRFDPCRPRDHVRDHTPIAQWSSNRTISDRSRFDSASGYDDPLAGVHLGSGRSHMPHALGSIPSSGTNTFLGPDWRAAPNSKSGCTGFDSAGDLPIPLHGGASQRGDDSRPENGRPQGLGGSTPSSPAPVAPAPLAEE